jgi:hypothetical protein
MAKRQKVQEQPPSMPLDYQRPVVETQAVEVQERQNKFSGPPYAWPTDDPLPDVFVKVRRKLQPCPACRRVRMDDLGQAAVCTHSGMDVVFFRCRLCGHRWKLAVQVAPS